MNKVRCKTTGRWKTPGAMDAPKPAPRFCLLCPEPFHAKGYCKDHYGSVKRLAAGKKPWAKDAKCRVCGGQHMAMGLCTKHYELRRTRLPLTRYRHMVGNAKKAGRSVSITFEQFCLLSEKPCHYCGEMRKAETGWGLDRIDSARGYDVDNVIPCCWTCNYMKRDRPVAEWLAHIGKILANMAGREVGA